MKPTTVLNYRSGPLHGVNLRGLIQVVAHQQMMLQRMRRRRSQKRPPLSFRGLLGVRLLRS